MESEITGRVWDLRELFCTTNEVIDRVVTDRVVSMAILEATALAWALLWEEGFLMHVGFSQPTHLISEFDIAELLVLLRPYSKPLNGAKN